MLKLLCKPETLCFNNQIGNYWFYIFYVGKMHTILQEEAFTPSDPSVKKNVF